MEAAPTLPVSWIRNRGGTPGSSEPATFRLASTVSLASVASALRPGTSRVAGTFDVTVEGAAAAPRLSAVQATLNGHGGSITAGGFTVSSPGGTRVRLAEGRLHVDTFRWKGTDSDIEASGYQVGAITNTEPGIQKTEVLYADGRKPEAQKVARDLGVEQVKPLDRELRDLAAGADVVVIAGEDRA